MRTISSIARDIQKDWENVNYAAAPYLQAMLTIHGTSGNCYQDSAESVIRYFLANAGTWRGPVAKAIKAELKAMI